MKKVISLLLLLALLAGLFVFGVDRLVVQSTASRLVTDASVFGADCILVLGCKVRDDGLSMMLEDRMDTAVRLYFEGVAPKLLLSGDHGTVDYDEVNAMLRYALDKGVPDEDIFLDHAGFCTYDSLYRAKYVFDVKKAVIVTQEYHEYRALYIADAVGIEAVGVATGHEFYGQWKRDVREVLARDKDFISCLFLPQSKYLGEVIPISGSGLPTRD